MKFKIFLIGIVISMMASIPFTSLTVKADEMTDAANDFEDTAAAENEDSSMPDYSDTSAPDPCDSPENLSSEQKLECLFPNEQSLIELSPQGDSGSTSLPSGNLLTDFLPFFINTALAITGTLIFISLLYGGYLFVLANDNEEAINQGKKIMTYSVIGAIVVAISYAAIYGLVNLNLD